MIISFFVAPRTNFFLSVNKFKSKSIPVKEINGKEKHHFFYLILQKCIMFEFFDFP